MVAVRLGNGGDAVLCHRRAPSRNVDLGRDIKPMLAEAEAQGLSSSWLVAGVASGLHQQASRPDLHFIERLARRGAVRQVLWSGVDAISRSPDRALGHLAAVSHAGAELHLLDRGPVGPSGAMILETLIRANELDRRWMQKRSTAARRAKRQG